MCISAAQTWREVHREVHQNRNFKELPGSQWAELRENRSEVADEGSWSTESIFLFCGFGF